jgi:hypothetical protein
MDSAATHARKSEKPLEKFVNATTEFQHKLLHSAVTQEEIVWQAWQDGRTERFRIHPEYSRRLRKTSNTP